ncbi:hypothetical protein DERF_008149 [Dermatophagoides farinae]|uniref:Uncharacterized protein n=1 Tax=Dermatophagoides farinae TaxID=6954 RepID=A0A922HZQ3_DERFA|nr:hypothetical protein DERF_008149 [Dermatophagoides farinae]
MDCRSTGSMPTVGSSNTNNGGLCTNAAANDTRRFWPPLNFATKRSCSGNSRNEIKNVIRSRIVSLGSRYRRPKKNSVSFMVNSSNNPISCGI